MFKQKYYAMKKLLNEPVIIFIFIGLILYFLHGWIVHSEEADDKRIFISNDQTIQLIAQFERTWMRSPTESEVQNLIQNYIRDEVYYREAVRMGLDQNDQVIRQRIRQKLEMLMDNMASATVPSDQMLFNYMDENKDRFWLEHRLSFRQVWINPDGHQDLEADAQLILSQLKKGASPQDVGDATLIGYEFDLLTESEITRQFGADFTSQIVEVVPGEWTGPIYSGLGVHLVKVTKRVEGRMPELSEIRKTVEREWTVERTKQLKEAAYQKLLEHYEVVYEREEIKE